MGNRHGFYLPKLIPPPYVDVDLFLRLLASPCVDSSILFAQPPFNRPDAMEYSSLSLPDHVIIFPIFSTLHGKILLTLWRFSFLLNTFHPPNSQLFCKLSPFNLYQNPLEKHDGEKRWLCKPSIRLPQEN